MAKPFNDKNVKSTEIKFFKPLSTTTWIDFANKNSIPIYLTNNTLEYIPYCIKKTANIRFLIDDANITADKIIKKRIPNAVRGFPTSTDKSEIAFLFTQGHIGVLYYDKKANKKYYIDTDGISNPEEKRWLMKNNGFTHVVANNKRYLDTRKSEYEDYCSQTSMSVAMQFIENKGELDLEKIKTNLNVTGTFLKFAEESPEKISRVTTGYGISKNALTVEETEKLNGFLKTLANKFRSEDNTSVILKFLLPNFTDKFKGRQGDFSKIFMGDAKKIAKYIQDPELQKLCASSSDYFGSKMLGVLNDVKSMKNVEPKFIEHFKSNVLKQNPSSLTDVKRALEQIESGEKSFLEHDPLTKFNEGYQIPMLSEESQKHLARKALKMLQKIEKEKKEKLLKLEESLVAYVERFKSLAGIKSVQGVLEQIESCGRRFKTFDFKGFEEEASQISLLSPESQKHLASKGLEILQKNEKELLDKLERNFLIHLKDKLNQEPNFWNRLRKNIVPMSEIKSCLQNIVDGNTTFKDASKLCNFKGGEQMTTMSQDSQKHLASKALKILQENEKELQKESSKAPETKKTLKKKLLNQNDSSSHEAKTQLIQDLCNLNHEVTSSSRTNLANDGGKHPIENDPTMGNHESRSKKPPFGLPKIILPAENKRV